MAESSKLLRDHGDYEELALIGNGKSETVATNQHVCDVCY
jgi:hypothetical protein